MDPVALSHAMLESEEMETPVFLTSSSALISRYSRHAWMRLTLDQMRSANQSGTIYESLALATCSVSRSARSSNASSMYSVSMASPMLSVRVRDHRPRAL